jgi:hypothetical protein
MNYKYTVIFLMLAFCLAVSGCSETATKEVLHKVSEPDIQLSNWDHNEGFDLSKGAYSDVSYTLFNAGDADGIINVVIESEKGVVGTSTEFVPANSRISNTIRADIAMSDKQIKFSLKNQRKSS